VKIRVVRAFNGYRIGQVFEWGDGMARIFIARGFIEPAEAKPVERAVVEEEVERAVIEDKPKRRRTGK
jgi:hypothetical protein